MLYNFIKNPMNNNNINHITGDLGTEFTNKSFTKFLNDNNISYDFYHRFLINSRKLILDCIYLHN